MDKKQMLAVILKHEGSHAAETHLVQIAHEEGDQAVAQIARNMTGAEIAQVTEGADMVCPSVLHGLITPKKFGEVWRRVGTNWHLAESEVCSPEILREFQEELLQFICAFILLDDDPRRRIELVREIVKDELGLEAMVFATIKEPDFDEFVSSGGKGATSGDWKEVVEIVSTHFQREWQRFRSIAVSIATVDDYHSFCHEVAADIYDMAVIAGGKQHEGGEEVIDSTLFKPL